jgi:hypothetical protein
MKIAYRHSTDESYNAMSKYIYMLNNVMSQNMARRSIASGAGKIRFLGVEAPPARRAGVSRIILGGPGSDPTETGRPIHWFTTKFRSPSGQDSTSLSRVLLT